MPKRRKRFVKPVLVPLQHGRVNLYILVGLLLFVPGLILLGSIFFPVIKQEVAYRIQPPEDNAVVMSRKDSQDRKLTASVTAKIIRPIDEDFGIVIPKIGANAKVIADVSPFNENEYQVELTKGVAHARDTALPGQFGNTFIFAHSAANWYRANQYNAVFYLLSKLQPGDSMFLFYKGDKYVYIVKDLKYVDSDALEYLKQDKTSKTLTLMTCWPPGTTLKRLIVTAELVKS